MISGLKLLVKKILAPILYRHRPIGLSAGKLLLYLDGIKKTNGLKGDLIEVGCNICGTTALGCQMLKKLESSRKYYCIDTFGGFVIDQFDKDEKKGTPKMKRDAFASNSIELAQKVLSLHKAEAKLIQADIVKFDASQLPDKISFCLLDVDLYEPIYAALEKIYPKMEKGGIILIDDCGGKTWKAGEALKDYVENKKIVNWRIEFGMGIIEI